jgi:hypothetical protein
MKTPAFVGLLLAVAVAGCSGSSSPASETFATTPAAVVTSDANLYRITLFSAPDPQPSRGSNSLRLVVTKIADGSPVTGLAVDMVPWMPAMGHGASTKPSVEVGNEPGSYVATNVNLFMSGLWELRTSIGGETGDHATAQFDIE